MESDSKSGEIPPSPLGKNMCCSKECASMAAASDTCRDSNNIDTLTVMNEDVVPDVSSTSDHGQVSQVL